MSNLVELLSVSNLVELPNDWIQKILQWVLYYCTEEIVVDITPLFFVCKKFFTILDELAKSQRFHVTPSTHEILIVNVNAKKPIEGYYNVYNKGIEFYNQTLIQTYLKNSNLQRLIMKTKMVSISKNVLPTMLKKKFGNFSRMAFLERETLKNLILELYFCNSYYKIK